MFETKLIATYGSLRKGQYNYERFCEAYPNEIKYIKTISTYGYKLYSLGPYPGVKVGNHMDDIILDLLEVSERVYDIINRMEIGAGYRAQFLSHEKKVYTIYIYQGMVFEVDRIDHGNWSKYLKQLIAY